MKINFSLLQLTLDIKITSILPLAFATISFRQQFQTQTLRSKFVIVGCAGCTAFGCFWQTNLVRILGSNFLAGQGM